MFFYLFLTDFSKNEATSAFKILDIRNTFYVHTTKFSILSKMSI